MSGTTSLIPSQLRDSCSLLLQNNQLLVGSFKLILISRDYNACLLYAFGLLIPVRSTHKLPQIWKGSDGHERIVTGTLMKNGCLEIGTNVRYGHFVNIENTPPAYNRVDTNTRRNINKHNPRL